MASATPIPLTSESQSIFIGYYKHLQDTQNTLRSSRRSRFLEIDKHYQREKNLTEEHLSAKQANAQGDATKFQDMTVPVVMPQVEAAVTYQASVFLTGVPIFGVVANPQFIKEAKQMEAILTANSVKGGWARELIMFFRDGFKYNFAPLEVSWAEEVTAAVETDLSKSLSQGIPKEVIWAGNKLRRLDPYNTFVDSRVPPTEVYKDGEFAGYTEIMSKIKLKSFLAALPDKLPNNLRAAFESPSNINPNATSGESKGFYIPDVNPAVHEDRHAGVGTNWMKWANLEDSKSSAINYKDAYEVTTLYVRILPSEFKVKVPRSNTPQIYKLIIVNHSVIVYAERQTNAHNYLPILIGQPLEDGLGYQTKSLADNGSAFQNLASAYMNSVIASRRRAVTDRVLYDPSRITPAHINSANPSAKIPVRPAAYGKNVADAVYQFPYREDQAATSLQQVQTILGMANTLAGQNLAVQGQFVKGNKTLHEYESVMRNANGRDQLAAILLESQVFTPMKLILKLDILQYQGGTTIYDRSSKQVVEIDPVALRKAVLDFEVSDGLIPSTKILNSDAFAVALQTIGSSATISQGYNIAPLFSYIVKSQGADITPFEKSSQQVAYEQAVSQWQQATMSAIEKGFTEQALPPMPTPEQFGYQPANNTPSPPAATDTSTPYKSPLGI